MRKAVMVICLLLTVGSSERVLAAETPRELVKRTAQEMQAELRENRQTLEADPTKIYGLVNEIVLPHFDFTLMSRWVLGKYWRQATPEQRQQFTQEFRTLLVRSYAGALLEYADEELIFPPVPDVPPDVKEATVHSEVQLKGQDPVAINYSLRRRDGEWKVYDVTVNGVSLVINYRSTFANQIRNEGIDAVIRDLTERNLKGKE
jgi:phospholipid transport system substrate-binding protein